MKYNYPGDVTIIDPKVQELIDALLGGLDEQALKNLLQMDPEEEIYWSLQPPDCRGGMDDPQYNLGSIYIQVSKAYGHPIELKTVSGSKAPARLQFKLSAPYNRSFAWSVKNLPDPKESEHGIIHQWIRLEEYNPGVFRQDVKFW